MISGNMLAMMAEDLTNLTDAELVAMSQADSGEAFDALTMRYYRPLRRYFYQRTGDHHRAEDLTQTTLLDAYRKRAEIVGERTFAGWLYRAAWMNLQKARSRQRVRRAISLEWLRSKVGDSPRELHQSDSCAGLTDDDLVYWILEKLGPSLAEPLLLQSFFGFSTGEIAEQLGISPAAARQRISRGKKAFRALYREVNGEEASGS